MESNLTVLALEKENRKLRAELDALRLASASEPSVLVGHNIVPEDIASKLLAGRDELSVELWLNTPRRELGGRRPLDSLAEGSYGTYRVRSLVERLGASA